MTRRSPSAVVSSRRTKQVFDEVEKVQYLVAKDFERHDSRQELFKKKFLCETRKHHQCICDAASNAMSPAAASGLLFARHEVSLPEDQQQDADIDAKSSEPIKAKKDATMEEATYFKANAEQQHIWNGLKSLYTPPDATTGIICNVCCAFRSAPLVHELPAPWQEFACESNASKHYYYHPDTKKVLWSPPAGTHALSVLVFERTNSVFTVCHCKPSHDRRRRLMQKFQEHAQQTAVMEAEKRNRQLHGAFRSLALTLVKSRQSECKQERVELHFSVAGY